MTFAHYKKQPLSLIENVTQSTAFKVLIITINNINIPKLLIILPDQSRGHFSQRAEQTYLQQTGWEEWTEWPEKQQEERGPGGEELLETSLQAGLESHTGLQWVANLHNANCGGEACRSGLSRLCYGGPEGPNTGLFASLSETGTIKSASFQTASWGQLHWLQR